MFHFLKSKVDSLKNSLGKTRAFLGHRLKTLLGSTFDAQTLESMEQLFYEADLGPLLAQELTQTLQKEYQKRPLSEEEALKLIKEQMITLCSKHTSTNQAAKPLVILIVGVNGNGKTTTIAKLAHHYQAQGKKVLLAAGDTFRAAAIEQLQLWAEKLKVDFVQGRTGGDPSSIAFDALNAASARGIDVVLIDTAGRLHTKTPLMQELQKIRRVCDKAIPGAPHEVWLVLDATTGQNGLDQAKTFHQFTPITGLVLTKMDGTAKGGIALALQQQLPIPLKFIGIGEGLDDLQEFDPVAFVEALLS